MFMTAIETANLSSHDLDLIREQPMIKRLSLPDNDHSLLSTLGANAQIELKLVLPDSGEQKMVSRKQKGDVVVRCF